MKFSVSLINSFYNYINETKTEFGTVYTTETNLIDMIKRIKVEKPRMTFGTAFHSIIESPLKHYNNGNYEYRFDLNENKFYIYEFDSNSLFEFEFNINRHLTTFEISNYFDFDGVQISMRYDAICPNEIHEFKTEFSKLGFNGVNIEKYENSLQHQIYMLSLEVYKSIYHIFQFNPLNISTYYLTNLFQKKGLEIDRVKFELMNYETIECYYNNDFETTLKEILKEFIKFVKINNLETFCQKIILT